MRLEMSEFLVKHEAETRDDVGNRELEGIGCSSVGYNTSSCVSMSRGSRSMTDVRVAKSVHYGLSSRPARGDKQCEGYEG